MHMPNDSTHADRSSAIGSGPLSISTSLAISMSLSLSCHLNHAKQFSAHSVRECVTVTRATFIHLSSPNSELGAANLADWFAYSYEYIT